MPSNGALEAKASFWAMLASCCDTLILPRTHDLTSVLPEYGNKTIPYRRGGVRCMMCLSTRFQLLSSDESKCGESQVPSQCRWACQCC